MYRTVIIGFNFVPREKKSASRFFFYVLKIPYIFLTAPVVPSFAVQSFRLSTCDSKFEDVWLLWFLSHGGVGSFGAFGRKVTLNSRINLIFKKKNGVSQARQTHENDSFASLFLCQQGQ